MPSRGAAQASISKLNNRDFAILSREAYSYEFDKFGNWTKMVTSLIVFENGELKREPVEVTYRTLTYYFDDNVAKIVEGPKLPEPLRDIQDQATLDVGTFSAAASSIISDDPPPFSVKSVAKKTTDNTDDANRHFLEGREFLKLQKDREAIKAFKESVRLNPQSPEAQYGLGLAYFRMGRNSDAADAFKKATVLSPGMAKAHYGLGMAFQELGLQGALREEYRILKTLDPGLAKQLMETSFLLSPPCANGPCR